MFAVHDVPRRDIDELVALYELEPKLRDVYVEGTEDQTIVEWVLSSVGVTNAQVYVIDNISVTSQLLSKYGLTSGNRSEVVALCYEIATSIGPSTQCVTGLVDRDSSAILIEKACSLLVHTDYSCMEMYLFSKACLRKLIGLSFPRVKLSPEKIVEQIAPILRELFLFRAAGLRLDFKLKWISPEGYIEIKNAKAAFRFPDFKRKYLEPITASDRIRFENEVEKLRKEISDDWRKSSNGHDAISVFGVFLRGFYKKAKDTDRTASHILRHLLTCSVEFSEIAKEPSFASLLDRVKG